MAAEVSEAPATAPILEGPGRYVVYEAPDGGWIINRTGGICETCQGCGCGEQADPVQIPALAIKLAQSQGRTKLMGMLKAAGKRGA